MVHPTCTLPGRRQARLNGDVELGRRPSLPHGEDVRRGAAVRIVRSPRIPMTVSSTRAVGFRSAALMVIGPRPRS